MIAMETHPTKMETPPTLGYYWTCPSFGVGFPFIPSSQERWNCSFSQWILSTTPTICLMNNIICLLSEKSSQEEWIIIVLLSKISYHFELHEDSS
jgi:hypothetical protein